MISPKSIVKATPDQIFSDLAGEVVILDLKHGVYYGLNEVGARIWHLIQQPKSVDEIREALLQEYEVEREQCERDVIALLEDLAAREMIEVRDEDDA